jgi:hypothetical protein
MRGEGEEEEGRKRRGGREGKEEKRRKRRGDFYGIRIVVGRLIEENGE